MMTSQTARVYVSVREPDLKFATLHARIGVACVYAGQARSDALHLHAANPACALGAGTRVRVCAEPVRVKQQGYDTAASARDRSVVRISSRSPPVTDR
jgi:hypothetical protein